MVRESTSTCPDTALLSVPKEVRFPTGKVCFSPPLVSDTAVNLTGPQDGAAHAFANYYPPTNPAYEAPPGDKPPLIVMAHGGSVFSVPSLKGTSI